MSYVKLVHTNPKLNEKTMWYRRVDITTDGEWYLATIWGPLGMISSTVHAVPRNEYREEEVREPKQKEVETAEEFI